LRHIIQAESECSNENLMREERAMKLVPDQRFKKKLMINAEATDENGQVRYVVDIGYMEIGVWDSEILLYRRRIPGYPENEVTLSFCESISAMIKSPTLMSTGWLTFVTPSFGVNHADLGTMVSRGEMELAQYLANDVETRSREYRRSGMC
jgi:hypothetical protein